MSSVIGTFESGIFGAGYFGVIQDAILTMGTVVNENIINAITQAVENGQQIGTIVTVEEADLSEYVESITIRSSEKSIASSCSLVIIGNTPASVSQGAAISSDAEFRFSDWSTFTNRLFQGSISLIQPASGSRQKSVSITAYDPAEALLSATPTNTTWTGTNVDLVASELASAGFLRMFLDFQSFSMAGVDLSGFATVRDLIIAAAGALDEVASFVRPDGTICVKSVVSGWESGLSIPMTGYTFLQETSNQANKFSTVTVQGLTGLTGSATGTGNTAYSETSAFLTTAANCQTKAEAIVARSEAAKRSTQIPLNPLIRIGDVISIDDDGTTRNCRITGITHTVMWGSAESSPGAWSNVLLEDVAA